MSIRAVDILLVEPDAQVSSLIQACLSQAMPCRVTAVSDSSSALREELTTSHQVVILSMNMPDAHWSELIGEIRRTNRAPFILLGDKPSTEDVLQALRLGAADVLSRPFELSELIERVRDAEVRASTRLRRRLRNRRLRRVTARIIHERRDLRQRMDLICKDFVQAYRRLAQRVTEADLLSHK